MSDIFEDHCTIENDLNRDLWLERRDIGIGSTDAPTILGLSSYKSALELYHQKLGKERPHAGEVEALRWGNILERPIAARYQEETGRVVRHLSEPGKFTLLRNKQKTWMHATIDGAAVGALADVPFPIVRPGVGVLEIKNVSSYVGERWKDEPPVEFIVQVQHQMAVTGAEWASIAGLIGGVLFVWQDIPRDQEFIDRLIELEFEFSVRIHEGNPPPPDGSAKTQDFLKWLYPKDKGTTINLGAEHLDLVGRYLEAKREVKAWEGKEREAKNELIALVGEHSAATLPDGTTFTYKLQQRAGFTVAPSEFRVLRVKERKGARLVGAGPGARLELPEYVEAGGE